MNMRKIKTLSAILILSVMLAGCGKTAENSEVLKAEALTDENTTASDDEPVSKQIVQETEEEPEIQEDYFIDELDEMVYEDPVEGHDVIFPSDWGNTEEINLLARFVLAEPQITPDKIKMVNAKDFDGNGNKELFVFVEDEYDADFDIHIGTLWFVGGNDYYEIPETSGKSWKVIDGCLDFGDKTYVYMSEYYTTDLISYVWELDNGGLSEPSFSRLGNILPTTENEFAISSGSYDGFLYSDDEFGEMYMGHTWKPYFFYYDEKEKSVKEYGAAAVDFESLDQLVNQDILKLLEDYEGSISEILYRSNGILSINIEEYADDGISFGNLNYDCKNKRFLDAWDTETGTVADSNYGGKYKTCICPEIAVFPTAKEVPFARVYGKDVCAGLGLLIEWGDEENSLLADYESVNTANIAKTDSTVKIVFMPKKDIKNLKFYELEFVDVDESGTLIYNTKDSLGYGELEYDEALVVETSMFGTIPNVGFSFTDGSGKIKCFSISESGKDGSIEIEEFKIAK